MGRGGTSGGKREPPARWPSLLRVPWVSAVLSATLAGTVEASADPEAEVRQPPAARQAQTPPADTRKEVEFLGFSADESVTAWRVKVRTTHHGAAGAYVDTYELTKLVDTATRKPLVAYRASAIQRRRLSGAQRRSDAAALRAAYPEWASAGPSKEWLRVRRRHRFDARMLEMQDSTVRLLLDDDLEDVQVAAESEHIEVLSVAGGGIGFRPIARLANGAHVSLGHYRVDGTPGVALRATVEVYHSRTAQTVAVLCHFFPMDKPRQVASMGTAMRLRNHPLATNAVGTMEHMKTVLRGSAQIFEELNGDDDPVAIDLYDRFIGKDW